MTENNNKISENGDTLLAVTPEPPYYAVIFSSLMSDNRKGYAAMAQEMVELASKQRGFLGVESAREQDGLGITVSYWQDENAIRDWKLQLDHQAAQKLGREKWYSQYALRVSKVERSYSCAKQP